MDTLDNSEALDIFLRHVREKRAHIREYTQKTVPRGAFLTNLSILSSAVASALTAAPAIGGIPLTQALGSAGENSPSWRILCAAATVCSLVATVATNLFRTHEIAHRLAKAQECDAKLETIELFAGLKQLSLKEGTARFEQCISEVKFIPPYPPIPSRWSRLFPKRSALDRVGGKINLRNGIDVSANCIVTGTASGLQPGLHLWLAVEANGGIWPKEGEVTVMPDGTWTKNIFEEGSIEDFALALYVVDSEVDRLIRNWFKEGDRTGHYVALHRRNGMLRLARIDRLHRVVEQSVVKPAT